MICVCIIIYPEWLFFNGIRTGVSQLCLGDIPRRENPTEFFSIPKISNYRRYHPQMVALRQWLSHILHPLGHPLGHPKRAKPKPRSKRSTLAVAPSVGSWNPFLQLKRGSSLEVSKWSSDMIMIFPLFQVRIMQISFLHPYFQFVSSDDPGSLSGSFNPRVVGHKSLLPLNIGVYREIQVI